MADGGGMVKAREQWNRGWQWPDWTFGKPPSTRRERIGAATAPSIFLFFLAEPVSEAFGPSHPIWWRVAVIATVVGYGVTYTATVVRGNSCKLPHRERIGWIAA